MVTYLTKSIDAELVYEIPKSFNHILYLLLAFALQKETLIYKIISHYPSLLGEGKRYKDGNEMTATDSAASEYQFTLLSSSSSPFFCLYFWQNSFNSTAR